MANQNPRIQQVAPDKYLGEPPAHLDLLMLYIDTRADGFTLLDATYAADRKRLDQVRTSCRVWIDEPEGDEVTHLILRAEKTNHLKDGFNAIWTLMRRGDDVQGKNAYLVHPPNPGAQYRAIIVLNPNPDGTFRAVAVDPATFVELEDENGQAKATEAATDSAAVAATDADPGISIQSFYRDSFRKHFDLIAKTLRNDPDGIRMRVHFGILNLKERPRKVNSWSFEKFEDLIQVIGKRATGRFDLNVGNDGTGRAVLDAVVRSPDRFEGLLSTELELKDVSPKYFLVIVASDWLLEIEVEPQPGSKSRMCQTRAYLIGSQNRHTEVRVSCPERKLDWNLEVLAEANTKSIPKAILDFRDRMVLGAIAGKDGRFPKPIFDGQLAKAANIDMIMGKAVFTYQMVSRPYRLEVSIRSTCRTVNGHLSSEKSPIKSCAVSMTGTWWDDELVPAQVLYRKRLWGSDHARLFPCPDEGGGDGFEVFGECVEMVHDLIEDAPGAGAAVS
ncbi:hypothetical protein NKR23_g118 [Pleurostoma richardsiae]|uniref:DUF7905 domain-containing protein n=1 Tax=Pleurostoma richardsiae TaxID=41990 RepID=A0AA38SDD9_9PEZI|nr:hypothetical protein NKR23_g118 [Pleurostoma richardsiae]